MPQSLLPTRDKTLENKRILVLGGTGSLGRVLLARILGGEVGRPEKIRIFSRDESKQHQLRLEYLSKSAATDEIIYYQGAGDILEFRIGDVRDYAAVCSALRDVDIVFNAAAMKQVPTCEYCPSEAIMTNLHGAENIVRAIRDLRLPVQTVIGISTDKAVKPVNVMGMTKAIQERIFTAANIQAPDARFIVVRYGNVLASRGSVIPLFHWQIRNGGPVTITDRDMTRFLLSLNDAVTAIFDALREANPAEIYVPRIPSARVVDVATALIGQRPIKTVVVGIRPGEKLHEVLISEEEGYRTVKRGAYYVISSNLPELNRVPLKGPVLGAEYSSRDALMTPEQVRELLIDNGLVSVAATAREEEFIR
jgi:FlaA1/EpsC-like NDP-sugar epimerase